MDCLARCLVEHGFGRAGSAEEGPADAQGGGRARTQRRPRVCFERPKSPVSRCFITLSPSLSQSVTVRHSPSHRSTRAQNKKTSGMRWTERASCSRSPPCAAHGDPPLAQGKTRLLRRGARGKPTRGSPGPQSKNAQRDGQRAAVLEFQTVRAGERRKHECGRMKVVRRGPIDAGKPEQGGARGADVQEREAVPAWQLHQRGPRQGKTGDRVLLLVAIVRLDGRARCRVSGRLDGTRRARDPPGAAVSGR